MSAASIRLYEAHTGRKPAPSITPRCFGRGRMARTDPPPPPESHCADVRAQAAELRLAAARILARADELDESANRISGVSP